MSVQLHRRLLRPGHYFLVSLIVVFFIIVQKQPLVLFVEGAVSCSTDKDCEQILRPGSECREGQCTNPFHNGGCLKNYFENEPALSDDAPWRQQLYTKTRICHSDDPPESAEKGYCNATPPFEYTEIRLTSQNWESSFFQVWMLQIILSEILNVPVTIETGFADLNVDFYNIDSAFDYGANDDLDALQTAVEVGDCRKLKAANQNPENTYRACSHAIPEFWSTGYLDVYPEKVEKGYIEPLTTNGGMAEQYWYIPLFTAKRDPSLLSFVGLAGEENRYKLAKRFKHPTTWKQYCTEVSPDNCATDDGIASRAPMDEVEENSMFAGEGLYIGHFRITDKNDCIKFPNNCTGFFGDYPCGWFSAAPQQLFYNDIKLDSGYTSEENSFSYSQLVEIWAAANATKSDVMMMWFNPDSLYQTYLGTDSEMTRVILPPPTQTCVENRASQPDRCTPNDNPLKLGNEKGACDYIPEIITKAVGGGLFQLAHPPDIPEALHSPAYDVIKNIQITGLQIGDIMDAWLERGTDKWNFDPRDATCQWMIQNIDIIESFIPETYPRVIKETSLASHDDDHHSHHAMLFTVSEVVAAFAILLVIASFVLVYCKRRTKCIHYAQIEYLFLLLSGLLLVSVGSFVNVLPPTDKSCMVVVWFVNLGYLLESLPLLIRIFIINRLVNTGKHMKRVRIRRRRLLGQVLGICNLLIVFLVIWTIIDPIKVISNYILSTNSNHFQASDSHNHDTTTTELSSSGISETVVLVSKYCSTAKYNFWPLVNLSWQAGIFFSSCVLVFLVRRVKEDMNNTKGLAVLVYVQFAFVLFRGLILLLDDKMKNWDDVDLMICNTFLHSMECIAALVIFIFPKVCSNASKGQETEGTSVRYDQVAADLFVDTTIIFADISGFSAWCSIRSPGDVFNFLDKVYCAFDEVADRCHVFKVETIGDCYVGATGLPQPNAAHAVNMAKFAIECMNTMEGLTTELEVVFGPDTADLKLRIGIHSGSVTGGYLQGQRAHFQLFGDTMNMAEWMESTGEKGRIHLSEATANNLIKAGRKNWIRKREDRVQTKGCGTLQTYWLDHLKARNKKLLRPNQNGTKSRSDSCDNKNDDANSSTSGFASKDGGSDEPILSHESDFGFSPERTNRLIDWNVEILRRLLVQIIARRDVSSSYKNNAASKIGPLNNSIHETIPLEEVKEIITLPEFDKKTLSRIRDADKVEIPARVMYQLKEYVTAVAGMYRENYFHNFEHASHVVMAVTKYMSRIIAPSNIDRGEYEDRIRSKTASTLHDHTYGITSDPLTQFACVYSALIHDVDHPGVPNPQLIKEDKNLAGMYKERSVAEQNSFDLAWRLLMEKRFTDLRAAIFCDYSEFSRFRQLVINSVMATDLGDKELKELRNSRWNKAFHLDGATGQVLENPRDDVNRKATIVIEHLIQASDVSHTMQHWDVYRKWNEQLFHECYEAYRNGRAESNPADGWYKGEIGFFDFYIIPLAKKLDRCGVFGVSSHENLEYAQRNREEWEAHGAEIVAEMLRKLESADKTIIEESSEGTPDSEDPA